MASPTMSAKKETKSPSATVTERRVNSLVNFVDGLAPGSFGTVSNPLSWPGTLQKDMRAGLLTLDWVTLSNAYAHGGIIQTLIDAPVDDAFRNGFKITSGELDDEDIKELTKALRRDIHVVEQTLKWARLFGGAMVIVASGDEEADEPLNEESIGKDDPVQFVSANRWECTASFLGQNGFQLGFDPDGYGTVDAPDDGPITFGDYQYYQITIDPTRVRRINGVEAPHYIRQILNGYGMSELERCLREINSFLKFQDLIFELVDEAKVDVYKIKGFNTLLASAKGLELTKLRVSLSNQLKNFQNAIVMDTEDEYEQKQLGQVFNGLASIYEQLRMNLAAALKFPMDKLFGQSASGLNATGEDTIENYNSIVESVQHKAVPLLEWVIGLRCRTVFGYAPDFEIEFPPLRVLGEVEEEAVKTSKQARAMGLFSLGVMSVESLEETLTNEGLISVKLEKSPEFRDEILSAGKPKPDEKPGASSAKKNDKSRKNALPFTGANGLDFLRSEKRRLRAAA